MRHCFTSFSFFSFSFSLTVDKFGGQFGGSTSSLSASSQVFSKEDRYQLRLDQRRHEKGDTLFGFTQPIFSVAAAAAPPPSSSSPVPVQDNVGEVSASLHDVPRSQLGRLAELYAQEILGREKRSFFQDLYQLVRAMLLGSLSKEEEEKDVSVLLKSEKDVSVLLQTKLRCVYFACQTLWHCRLVLEILDERFLKLLADNERFLPFPYSWVRNPPLIDSGHCSQGCTVVATIDPVSWAQGGGCTEQEG